MGVSQLQFLVVEMLMWKQQNLVVVTSWVTESTYIAVHVVYSLWRILSSIDLTFSFLKITLDPHYALVCLHCTNVPCRNSANSCGVHPRLLKTQHQQSPAITEEFRKRLHGATLFGWYCCWCSCTRKSFLFFLFFANKPKASLRFLGQDPDPCSLFCTELMPGASTYGQIRKPVCLQRCYYWESGRLMI